MSVAEGKITRAIQLRFLARERDLSASKLFQYDRTASFAVQ
jgi:hypothetical protein